jgi:hypothetical protein
MWRIDAVGQIPSDTHADRFRKTFGFNMLIEHDAATRTG